MTGQLGLHTPHGMINVGEGFVAHMREREGLSGQVDDPVMQLVVTSHYKATNCTVGCMGNE